MATTASLPPASSSYPDSDCACISASAALCLVLVSSCCRCPNRLVLLIDPLRYFPKIAADVPAALLLWCLVINSFQQTELTLLD